MKQTLDIDLGKDEWALHNLVERGALGIPDNDTRAMCDRVRKILGDKNLDVMRVRIRVPDIGGPALYMRLGAILTVLDAWGIDKELIYE